MKIESKNRAALVALLCLVASGCATTAADYVDGLAGFSVTRGRLLRVNGLVSESITPLADGVVFAIDGGPCQVALEFADGSKRVLNLSSPDQLVCASDADFVLQPARSPRGEEEPRR